MRAPVPENDHRLEPCRIFAQVEPRFSLHQRIPYNGAAILITTCNEVTAVSLTAGTCLGHYEILALIGAGGMGEVYKATDTRLDRTVAIKLLREHISNDPESKARFEREARTIAGL